MNIKDVQPCVFPVGPHTYEMWCALMESYGLDRDRCVAEIIRVVTGNGNLTEVMTGFGHLSQDLMNRHINLILQSERHQQEIERLRREVHRLKTGEVG